MTMTNNRGAVRERIRPVSILVEKADALVRVIAQPSFVQLVYAYRACRAVLAFRHSEMERLFAIERHRCLSLQR